MQADSHPFLTKHTMVGAWCAAIEEVLAAPDVVLVFCFCDEMKHVCAFAFPEHLSLAVEEKGSSAGVQQYGNNGRSAPLCALMLFSCDL